MALPATRKSKRKTLWQMRKPWVPRSRSRVCELCPVQSIIEYCGKLIGILRYSFGCFWRCLGIVCWCWCCSSINLFPDSPELLIRSESVRLGPYRTVLAGVLHFCSSSNTLLPSIDPAIEQPFASFRLASIVPEECQSFCGFGRISSHVERRAVDDVLELDSCTVVRGLCTLQCFEYSHPLAW